MEVSTLAVRGVVCGLVKAALGGGLALLVALPVAAESESGTLSRDLTKRLEALGYASGVEEATSSEGVLLHDRSKVQPGLNLVVSAHAPEAELIDMDGRVVHTWRYETARAFPNSPLTPSHHDNWRRVHLDDDGNLVVLWDSRGLAKLDERSHLLWLRTAWNFHHDFFLGEDGLIFGLTRRQVLREDLHPSKPIWEDFITVLDRDGRTVDDFSILEAFKSSPYAAEAMELFRSQVERWDGDVMHTNGIEVFDGALADRGPIYAKGNILVTGPKIGFISIVDPKKKTVVWSAFKKTFVHEATLLPNGNILYFENQPAHDRDLRRSAVVEIDPADGKEVWRYDGDDAKQDTWFYSANSSTAARLANGNTLITSSDEGRVLEVTPDGVVAWEYRNPKRVGEEGDTVAVIFDMIRVPEGFTVAMREERPGRASVDPPTEATR